MSPRASAQAVIDARTAHLSSWAVDGTGAMLGIWARGWDAGSPGALAVRPREGRESLSPAVPGGAADVAAALPTGWLVRVRSDADPEVVRVDHDATVHPLEVSPGQVAPRAGDVAVEVRGSVVVYRPADDALHPVRQPAMRWRTSAYVTPNGALVVAGSSGGAARWARLEQGRWSQGRWDVGVSVSAVAGIGDDIAVALGGSPAEGVDATPVAGLAISDDAGTTWREVGVPGRLDEALSIAVTSDGTAFVTTGSGALLRVRPEGAATVVRSVRPIAVSAAGGRLYALDAPGRTWTRERVLVSVDRGRSWTPGTLPGRGSA